MKFESLINEATNYVANKEFEKAILGFQEALKIEPNNKKIFYNIGVCYLNLDKNYLAIDFLLCALRLDKEYINAHTNIAIAYKRLEEYAKALFHLKIAQKAKPNDSDILYNLANIHSSLEQYDIALKIYTHLITLEPENYKAMYGIGLIYNYLLDFDRAKHYFIKTLQLKKDYADGFFALSLIELRQKDYINGWNHYESRWEANNPLKALKYAVQQYNGEPLENKTILVQEEQGFGDNIQLIRYIDLLKKQNPKKIYVAVRKPLYKLFQHIERIDVVNDQEVLYGVDFVLSLHSAPRIFKTTFTTIPNRFPYLPIIKAPLQKELEAMLKTTKLKVGFAHLGNPEQKNAYYKSIPLEIFQELFKIRNINFYSLQIDPKAKQLQNLTKEYDNVFDLSPYISDFYDSANILNHLDMMIVIDSALSHFAGAYNKPTLLLAPKNYDWRWVNENGISPWYPSIEIIEQKNLGIWNDVIEACASKLEAHIKA